ncbi:MAG: ComF family protein [Firmicutes bacterium]|nr:ComF family protein [Bacillota bacterium]
MDKSYQWKKQAAAVFFPQRVCPVCGGFSTDGACPDCRRELASLRPCPVCATFIPATESEFYRCHGCSGREPSFEQARAAGEYGGVLREKLLAFKYRGRTGLRRPLAALLCEAWQRWYGELTFDAVIPVPLHERRLAERGYNQVELLTAILSREQELPHAPGLLRRVKDTPPLSATATRRSRFELMRGAFAAEPDCRELRVLLVDDIFTTGATAEAASLALLRQGAASVRVLTVAAGRES